ncbi:MAG: hypothetical protein PHP26_06785 [Syntrophomonas sp.]|nr:hypothetical protein [Syntrophomonas sp.]
MILFIYKAKMMPSIWKEKITGQKRRPFALLKNGRQFFRGVYFFVFHIKIEYKLEVGMLVVG